MRHQHGVAAMKLCAMLLLVPTVVFLCIFWARAVPNYGETAPIWVTVSLGSMAGWVWVVWGSESVRRSAFALAIALLYCLLTLPYTALNVLGVGRTSTGFTGSYPHWAVYALIAVWFFGLIVGGLISLRAARR